MTLDRSLDERDLDLVPSHEVGDGTGVRADDVQFNSRMRPMESAEVVWKHVRRDRCAGAALQRSLAQAARGLEFLLCRPLGRERRSGVTGQRLAFPRRPNPLGTAVQEAAADLGLDVAHAFRDGRLADAEDLGRMR